MTDEEVIEMMTSAINHRTISHTGCWYIIFYHDRICCVPTNVSIPPEIILGQFNEYQAHVGFTSTVWSGLKTAAIHFFKELYK